TTVLGLFLQWESPIEEEVLYPGDLLVICTDGVTEAPNPPGEEYGEVRLAELIRENRQLPVNELLAAIQASVEQFSGATQADDITRSEEHTSELQSRGHLVCRLLLEKKKKKQNTKQ